MSLKDIISVSLTKGTRTISTKSFGIPLIVGTTTAADRTKVYTSIDGVLEDYASSTPEYKAALSMFSAKPTVQRVVIGQPKIADADISETLTAIENENSSWFGLILCDRTVGTVTVAAAWIEAKEKIFITASDDSNIKDQNKATDTTSIAYSVQNSGYENTHVFYHSDAANIFPDAALMALLLAADVGSLTPEHKALPGISADNLTPNEEINIASKNAGFYREIAGINAYSGSKTGSGEWIDVVISGYWMIARLQESCFTTLANAKKIPYTGMGLVIMESAIRTVCEQGITLGSFSEFAENEDGDQIGGYLIEMPDIADIAPAQKATRDLVGISVTAWLAGAIHTMKINVFLTY